MDIYSPLYRRHLVCVSHTVMRAGANITVTACQSALLKYKVSGRGSSFKLASSHRAAPDGVSAKKKKEEGICEWRRKQAQARDTRHETRDTGSCYRAACTTRTARSKMNVLHSELRSSWMNVSWHVSAEGAASCTCGDFSSSELVLFYLLFFFFF